ncbi:hypothetical protein HMPREF9946_01464 [Acetobacteraceae bacterium AT-5844]|nr:hypothetical protein HMPREF9946_01464 [Acetobacteraceae bacterium AT-5844]
MLLRWISFRGRISLGRYWLQYIIPLFLLSWLALGIDVALFGWPVWVPSLPQAIPSAQAQTLHYSETRHYALNLSGPVSTAWFWLSFIPGLAGMTKRWHDRGRSGWWCLLLLLPVIGWLWIFFSLCCRDGVRGANRFGPDPLEPAVPGTAPA